VAGVSRLRDELSHDRRALACPPRDLSALALREQPRHADQPAAADGGVLLALPTRLVAEAIRDQSAERAAAVFYGSCLLAIALLFSALWGAVARDRKLLKPEVTHDEVNAILVASSPSIGLYAGAIALAIVAPRAAAFGYLLAAVVGILRVRGDEVAAEPA
jgi:hypothetical protein